MIKKIMAVLMTFVLSMSLVGCSNDSSDKKTTPKKTTTSSSIKTVSYTHLYLYKRQNLDKYFIVRIAWVFGVNGKNFIKTMLNVGKKYPQVKVVNDQIGTPTYTYDLARLLVDMAESDKYGYYHATNEGGYISWYDFTVEIFKQAGYTTEVLPVTTEEYGLSKAARPFNSRLDKSKLVENGFKPLPTWQDARCV